MSLIYNEDRSWMRLPRHDPMWKEKFRDFINITFAGTSRGGTVVCPFTRCQCMVSEVQSKVSKHLRDRGFAESSIENGQSSSALGVNDPHHVLVNAGGGVEDVHNEGGAPDFGLDNDGAQDLGIDNEEGEQSEDHAATNTMIHSIIRGATLGENQ